MQTCPQCQSTFELGALSCPGCQRLVHRGTLNELSKAAREFAASGQTTEELGAWRTALTLLPAGSRQHTEVLRRIEALSTAITGGMPNTTSEPQQDKGSAGKAAGLGAIGLMLWKLKWVIGFAATKLKFLLLGLTKMKTLFSMLLTMGVYWTMWGWPFAVGFVLSIYVHEIGHVAALRRLGIPASAPMFIPGFGAFVRMHQYPASPAEDARVGLAGPVWGTGAAAASYLLFLITGWPLMAGLARAGAWLNLFNLLPIWQLDGGRAMNAMTKRERMIAAAVLIAAWFLTGESLLLFLALAAGARVFMGTSPEHSDRYALVTYSLLVAVLSAMTLLHVPGLPLAR